MAQIVREAQPRCSQVGVLVRPIAITDLFYSAREATRLHSQAKLSVNNA